MKGLWIKEEDGVGTDFYGDEEKWQNEKEDIWKTTEKAQNQSAAKKLQWEGGRVIDAQCMYGGVCANYEFLNYWEMRLII